LTPAAEERLGDLARWFLENARSTGEAELALRITQLRHFASTAARQWGEYDAVLTPALAFAPPAIGEFWARGPAGDYRLQCEWAPQTSMVNVVGVPAIAVPLTSDAAGLPRGVQLIGRPGTEHRLLQLAEQLTA
jgi:amidase